MYSSIKHNFNWSCVVIFYSVAHFLGVNKLKSRDNVLLYGYCCCDVDIADSVVTGSENCGVVTVMVEIAVVRLILP